MYHMAANLAPFMFPKRMRRVGWAATLTEQNAEPISEALYMYSALAPNSNISIDKTKNIPTFEVDGITYTNFLPKVIRNWYGVTPFDCLNIEAMSLNKASVRSLQDAILRI